ncbi:HRH1 protein, partial [Rhinopomastus cyanomelas]|nr:HRH1 protein [Rhinopomastus cyanomelas]
NNGQREVKENKCETEFSEVTWFKVLTAIVNFYLPSVLMLWLYCKIFRAVRQHCQHRELINGPHRPFTEKNPICHSKMKDEQNICLQKQILDEKTSPKDKQSSHQPKGEAELHFRNPDKSSKAFISKSSRKILAWSPLPLTTAQPGPGLDKAGHKCMCATKENAAEEVPCSQHSDLSDGSDNHTFTDSVTCREQHPSHNPARACTPQERTASRDNRGSTYLRKTWQRLYSLSNRHIQGLYGNRARKAAQQLGVIMAVFMLCWIPYFVVFMVIAFHGAEQFSQLHMFTVWLGYVNSTLNPFLYPLCNQNFKKTFKKILHI